MSYVPYPRPCGDFRTSYAADMTMFRTRGAMIMACAGVALLLALPLFASDYVLSQLILIGIYGIAALGLNVLVGFTGQISLGHSAFFGFGAFASAWLGTKHGVPPLISIPIAGVMTTALGMVFGIPAARLKGLYLAIATLAAQFILEDFFARADWFTGARPELLPSRRACSAFRSIPTGPILCRAVLVRPSYVGVANLVRTRDGRALIAVRDHYLSAEVMGINLTRYRILSFGISSFFAGIGGALYAHYLGFVSAEAFTILLSIQFLAMVIIGGLGSVASSVLGTAFVLLLPQVMQAGASTLADFLPAMQQGVAYIKEMSIGAAIMLFLIFEPEGLIHRWRLIRASLKLYPFSY
jgi:branched-chain amino acid transport system permease protein